MLFAHRIVLAADIRIGGSAMRLLAASFNAEALEEQTQVMQALRCAYPYSRLDGRFLAVQTSALSNKTPITSQICTHKRATDME